MNNNYIDEIYTAYESISPSSESKAALEKILNKEQIRQLYIGLNYEIINYYRHREELNFKLKWLKNYKFKEQVMNRIDNKHFNFRLFLENHHIFQIKSNLKKENLKKIFEIDQLLRAPIKELKSSKVEILILIEIRNFIKLHSRNNVDLFYSIHDRGDKNFHGTGKDIFISIAKDFKLPFHSDRSLHEHILKLRTTTP